MNKKSINIFLLSVVCVFIFLINKYDLNELKKNSVYIIKQNIKLVSFFSFLKINNSFNLSKTEKVEFEIDEVGVISIASKSLAITYLNAPDAWSERIRNGYLVTTDIGHIEDGKLIGQIRGVLGLLLRNSVLLQN